MSARIRLDVREFETQLAKLRRPAAPIARALNRSLTSGRALGARLVAAEMGLKVSVVKALIRTSSATQSNLTATIYASAKRIPLIDFGARGPEPSRGRRGGVTAKLRGGPGRYPHAFIATMPSGHRGVFMRRQGASRRGAPPHRAQLPIVELKGPSIWQSFQRVAPEVTARTTEQLGKNIASEIAYALSRV